MKITVNIISCVKLDESVLSGVTEALSEIADVDVNVVNGVDINISDKFRDKRRGQVDGSRLLSYLESLYSVRSFNLKYLFVLDEDAFVPGLNFIFGIARTCGGHAIVFAKRLRPEFWGWGDESVFSLRLCKEIVHELGHTLCLDHCPDRSCVMSFSNTILDVDRKGHRFCSACVRNATDLLSSAHLWART